MAQRTLKGAPKLSKKAATEFRRLVNDINARGFDNAARVIARVRMTSFVAEHGKEACDAEFAKMESRRG